MHMRLVHPPGGDHGTIDPEGMHLLTVLYVCDKRMYARWWTAPVDSSQNNNSKHKTIPTQFLHILLHDTVNCNTHNISRNFWFVKF